MKLSTQEEYGLRCLLQLARAASSGPMTIPEISRAEGLSAHNVAKMLRVLRRGGLVVSSRGQRGGYALSRPPGELTVQQALRALGGRLYDTSFCRHYAGSPPDCARSYSACSLRALWDRVQRAVDDALRGITLQDLVRRGHYKFADPEVAELELLRIAPPRSSASR